MTPSPPLIRKNTHSSLNNKPISMVMSSIIKYLIIKYLEQDHMVLNAIRGSKTILEICKQMSCLCVLNCTLQVELYDRSLLAGDVVQKSNCESSSGQLGTVRMVHVTCNLQVQSTKQVIYNVSSAKIQQITVSIYRFDVVACVVEHFKTKTLNFLHGITIQ